VQDLMCARLQWRSQLLLACCALEKLRSSLCTGSGLSRRASPPDYAALTPFLRNTVNMLVNSTCMAIPQHDSIGNTERLMLPCLVFTPQRSLVPGRMRMPCKFVNVLGCSGAHSCCWLSPLQEATHELVHFFRLILLNPMGAVFQYVQLQVLHKAVCSLQTRNHPVSSCPLSLPSSFCANSHCNSPCASKLLAKQSMQVSA